MINPDLERDGLVLHNIHSEEQCAGRTCIIHNPTDHPMRSWPLHWRGDRGIFERICEHGTGHPDWDQDEYWTSIGAEHESIHGCDGCCGGWYLLGN